MNTVISEILRLIDSADHIALLSHDRPDGDAIGSQTALTLMLEAAGKTVFPLNIDGVPDSLKFLPCIEKVKRPEGTTIIPVDLIVSLDSAGKDRINSKVWALLPSDCPIINIDHHISNTGYGQVNLVNPKAPATGEIVYDLAQAAGWHVSREAAENLFAAISTDTGSFRYSATTPHTYRIAATLIEAGVDLGTINQRLYENFPLRRVECLRALLNHLKISFAQRCASVLLTNQLKTELSLRSGDTEGIIDIIRAIDTVQVAVFFEEMEDGGIRISVRSKKIDIGKICEQFGGGGHPLAAGARLPGPSAEAEHLFLTALGAALDANSPEI